jgi:TusA-related sulfurtransferase
MALNKKILIIFAIIVISVLIAAYFLPSYKSTVNQTTNSTKVFNQTAMLERGNMAMGFNQTMIHHHFMSTATGGEIMIMSTNQSDVKTINEIRSHVKEIQYEFSAGNFTKPFYIHAQIVPGTDIMTAKKDLINYSIKDIDSGSILVLTTNDTKLLDAIQQFMNFQSSQHMDH